MLRSSLLALSLAAFSTAHTAAWAPGMYCKGGPDPAKDDPNTHVVVNPLFNLAKADWWFQHHRGCDKAPPKAGEFLELPANGKVTVELAHNRAYTSLSFNGQKATDWPDGKHHPEDWNGWGTDGTPSMCLKEDGAMHTWNQSSAGGTAFAISYHSNLEEVTMENLVVFTTRYHTPWKRVTTYDVPDLPACPEGGCTCAWLWVPNGCGQANMYMQGFKCNVTGASRTAKPLAKAQAPVYCEHEPAKCVKGAKQMLAWHQATGNNIETAQGVTPNYNQKCGWAEGAQKDIFQGSAVQSQDPVAQPQPGTPDSSPDAAGQAVSQPNTETKVVTPGSDMARPHPWISGHGKSVENKDVSPDSDVARPHPWVGGDHGKSVDNKDVSPDSDVARPHPWVGGNTETKDVSPGSDVARPHPWTGGNGGHAAKVARPYPGAGNSTSVLVPSGVVTSTFATLVTGTPARPTSATDAVTTTSCTQRRPRYTPGVAYHWV